MNKEGLIKSFDIDSCETPPYDKQIQTLDEEQEIKKFSLSSNTSDPRLTNEKFVVVDFAPKDLSIGNIQGMEMFNLPFSPKDKTFKRFEIEKDYCRENMMDLENDFNDLGYGRTLSKIIRQCAANGWPWTEGSRITLLEEQHLLISELVEIYNKTIHPIALDTKRRLKKNDYFLILKIHKIYLVSSRRLRNFALGGSL